MVLITEERQLAIHAMVMRSKFQRLLRRHGQGAKSYDLVGLVLDLEDLLGCPVNVIEETTLTDDRFSQRVRKDAVAF